MKFKIIDCEQRSDEWRIARMGRLTGSRAVDMMARVKSGGYSTARRNVIQAMALEQVTGRPEEQGPQTYDMRRGSEKEPEIICAYEALTGEIVQKTGFLACESIMAGCSLDGHVNNFEGIQELKAPKQATHFDYLQGRVVPAEYYYQCVHNLWVTGAQWCDFISWHPDYPAHMQIFRKRMLRDEALMETYGAEVHRLLAEVMVRVAEIRAYREEAA